MPPTPLSGKRLTAMLAEHPPTRCSRCGYDLRGLPRGPCPECGCLNAGGLLGQTEFRPGVASVLGLIDAALVICVLASVALLGVNTWRSIAGSAWSYMTTRWVSALLTVPFFVLYCWATTRRSSGPDPSMGRAVYGVLGVALALGALIWAWRLI